MHVACFAFIFTGITTTALLLFVGDTWGPDVAGPTAAGIAAVYLRRDGHWPDGTCPHDEPSETDVPVIADLRGLFCRGPVRFARAAP